MPLPINKQNGDSLTASEFNEVVSGITGNKLPIDPSTGLAINDTYGLGDSDYKVSGINGEDIDNFKSILGQIKVGVWRYPDKIPSFHVALVGQVLSRETYSNIYTHFIDNGIKVYDASGNLVTADQSGDGSTTFHMLNAVDGSGGGRFFKMVNSQSYQLGESQEDSTKMPNIAFTGVTSTDGEHNHIGGAPQANTVSNSRYGEDSTTDYGSAYSHYNNYTREYYKTSDNGDHSHTTTITGGGDSYTQPHCINVTAIMYTGV